MNGDPRNWIATADNAAAPDRDAGTDYSLPVIGLYVSGADVDPSTLVAFLTIEGDVAGWLAFDPSGKYRRADACGMPDFWTYAPAWRGVGS